MAYTYSLFPWTECGDLGFGTAETMGIGVCVTSNGTIVTLTKNGTSWGVCRSTDEGGTWSDHFTSSTPTYMSTIRAFDATVVAVGYGASGAYYFKSTDHGASWSQGYFNAGVIGNAFDLIYASDSKYYLAANKVVYYSSNLTSWTATTGWASSDWRYFRGGICQAGSGGTMYAAGYVDLGVPRYWRIWSSTSPYTSWSVMESDFDVVYASCYHNGSMYVAGYTGGTPDIPTVWKLIGSTWTPVTLPNIGIGGPVINLYSINDEQLVALTGTTANFSDYGCLVSYDDGDTWFSTGLDVLEVSYDPNAPPQSSMVYSNGKLYSAATYNGEGQVYKAAINTFLTPAAPTDLSVSPIGGGNIISVDSPPQEWFNGDLSNWTVTKQLGTETATITTRTYYTNTELTLDCPDSADTEIFVTCNQGIPAPHTMNWELDLDIISYNPDSTTTGLIFSFGMTDGIGDNYFRIRCRQEGSDFNSLGQYRINGGSETNLFTYEDAYWHSFPSKLKITHTYGHLNCYAFYEISNNTYKWISLGGISFGIYAGQLVYPFIAAWDYSTRGGSVVVDNVRYKQLNSIYYDTSSGVTTLTGSKIEKRLLPYLHITDDQTYYIATAENDFDESTACSEENSTPTAGFTKGSITVFNSGETTGTRVIKISDDYIAVCGTDIATNYIKCSVYSVSGVTPTLIDSEDVVTDVETGSSFNIDCCCVDTNKWIIVYRQNSTNELKVNLLSFSNPTITNHGQKLTTTISTPSVWSCDTIENNKFGIIYSNDGADDQEGIIGEVSGTSISWGSVADLETSGQDYHMHCCAVNSSQMFSAFYDNNVHEGRRITISGTTMTPGNTTTSEYNQQYMDDHVYSHTCSPKMDRVIVAYDYYDRYRRDQRIGRLQIVSGLSNSEPTWGVPYEYKNEGTQNNVLAAIDANHIVVAYSNRDTEQGEVIIFEVDWDNDTFSPIIAGVFETGYPGGLGDRGLDVAVIDRSTIAIAYQDDDDNDYGKLRLLSFSLPADLPETPQNPAASDGVSSIDVSWDENFENEYFSSIDNFTFVKLDGTETATVVSNTMRLDIPDGINGQITAKYDQNDIPAGDFSITIDFSNYSADDPEGPPISLKVVDSEVSPVDYIKIWYRSRTTSPNTYIQGEFYENSVSTTTTAIYPSNIPTKLRIERVGTIFYIYYYENGFWYPHGSQDFTTRAVNIVKLWIDFEDTSSHGGSVDLDNLILNNGTDSYNIYYDTSPGVTVATGTKITGVTTPYEHTPPSLGTYYYIITAENDVGEGTASSEVSAKTAPVAPATVNATAGFEKNTITWTAAAGATSYNIYWRTSSPVTKLNGTKISGVTSPHEHTSLTKNQPYYYIVTSENDAGEGPESSEATATPYGTPDAPTGISATSGGGSNIITFTIDPFATKTHIYWGTSSGVTKLTGTKISDVTSPYTHSSLNPSLTYYYILTCENVYGEGDASSEYSSSPYPEPPTGVGISEGIEKNAVEWTDSLGADSYNIYWSTSSPVTKLSGTKITGVTSPYLHTALTAWVEIFYVVTAVDEDGESAESSEESGTPWPPSGGPELPQPPVEQYSVLETFSDNDYDNLIKLDYSTIGTPPISSYDKDIGNIYDLYESLEVRNCITDNSFNLEILTATSIKVNTGRCSIKGVCIDFKSSKTLYINSDDSYFDWSSSITSSGVVYILAYYDTSVDGLGYIGLMKKTDYVLLTSSQKEDYCFIGAINIDSSVEIVSPLYYWDPDDTSQERPFPRGFADGGWLDIPDEFIV